MTILEKIQEFREYHPDYLIRPIPLLDALEVAVNELERVQGLLGEDDFNSIKEATERIATILGISNNFGTK